MIAETSAGLYCEAGGFHVDPWLPVERAVITHAHSDHARPGSTAYLCAEPGRTVLQRRLPDARIETLPYGERRTVDRVTLSFHPSGHILGASQVRIEHRGDVWVVSGDYKRQPDATCEAFEVVPCHTFITEATFALPIYTWDPTASVVDDIRAITGGVSLVHSNNSRDDAGSGRDRHAGLLDGTIPPELLLGVVSATDCPVILETPGGPAERAAEIDWLRARLA